MIAYLALVNIDYPVVANLTLTELNDVVHLNWLNID